jgi:TDG/mug DNA glycosylase family protein
MIKYRVRRGARILFIGINPHYGSFRRGVPFSNNKMFWYLLAKSGLITENIADLKDDTKLKKVYKNKFSSVYRLNLLNVVNRPSFDITELKRGEERRGRIRISNAIKNFRPKIVCFVGKTAFQKLSGKQQIDFGSLAARFNCKRFVMHCLLRGKAIIRIRELKLLAMLSESKGY